MEKSKLIYTGEEALDKIKNGVRAVADVVQSTFGHKGMNVLLSRDWRVPDITNDGVTIARSIELDDEAENYVKEVFVDSAIKTNEQAGDGTTGSIILARAILEQGWKKIEGVLGLSESNAMEVRRDIEKDKGYVLEELKKVTKKCDTVKDLKLVALTSVENEEIGDKIAEMVFELGGDSHIGVEEGFTTDIEYILTKGMKFHGTYANECFCTNDRKEVIYKDIDILLTNMEFTSISVFKNIFQEITKSGKKSLLVFGKKFSFEIIVKMAEMRAKGFNLIPVKIPSLLTAEHQDIEAYTRARFLNGCRRYTS